MHISDAMPATMLRAEAGRQMGRETFYYCFAPTTFIAQKGIRSI